MIVDHRTDDSTPPGLVIHTVRDRPDDYPDQVIVTRDHIRQGGITRLPTVWSFASIAEARTVLERLGLFPLPRQPDDQPNIVESWI